jgi:hypothetical protein
LELIGEEIVEPSFKNGFVKKTSAVNFYVHHMGLTKKHVAPNWTKIRSSDENHPKGQKKSFEVINPDLSFFWLVVDLPL